ncbi:glycosyltransferase family 4 protein [Methanobacterium sp. ACI-7]|uniref:glycosyltransferase family 4 protein n=1 Tax=unclassified Methanobacterium TaxID=2627676 RepID=UPI0039C35CF7
MSEEKKQLKIAFINATDPRDKKSLSGTIYYMAQSLQRHCGEVCYIGPLETKMQPITKYLGDFLGYIFKKNYFYDHSTILSRSYARIIKNKLKNESFDVIFAPFASTEIAFLNSEIPIIYLSDATFDLISNTEYFPDVLDISKKEAELIEKKAIEKANLLLYPSKWAANSALNHYFSEKSKVHVVPFGANIEEIPPKEVIMKKKRLGKCKLLFLGVDWERKGGRLAFETLLELENRGIMAELTVVGCIPPEEFKHDKMAVIPFLDKNDDVQFKKLENLFIESDFLILPTRTEAYGIVFCEANAFGLPVITTDTGGVSSIINDGINGFMLPLDAKPEDYAKLIKDIYLDDEKYNKMVVSSRELFEDKFNWDHWGKEVFNLINEKL